MLYENKACFVLDRHSELDFKRVCLQIYRTRENMSLSQKNTIPSLTLSIFSLTLTCRLLIGESIVLFGPTIT